MTLARTPSQTVGPFFSRGLCRTPQSDVVENGGVQLIGIGVLGEYLWDEREQQSPSAFQNDVFAGLRLAGNDVAGTDFLAGIAFDCDHASRFASVEASRRLGAAGKLSLELRIFDSEQAADPLQPLRRDDYLRVEYTHYF